MFSSNKILSIVFVLLFLFLIGEVVYLITTGNRSSLSTKSIPSIAPTLSIAPTKNSDVIVNQDEELAFNLHELEIKKGVLISSILTDTYEGKVFFIGKRDPTTETSSEARLDYDIKMTIKNNKNADTSFYYGRYNIDKTRVQQTINNKTKSLNLNDLKVGDEISVVMVFDIKKDTIESLVSTTIEKK